MDDEIEPLLLSVRADTALFRRDVAEIRGELEGPLGDSAARAGRAIEHALTGALRSGKLGFEDLKRVALSAMAEIAASALRSGIGAATGGGRGSLGTIIASLFGLPGRAGGGLVGPGNAYLVGERGPELFVPTSSGRIEPGQGSGAQTINLNVTVAAPAGTEPRALQQSSRQLARAVKQALLRAE